MKLDGNVMGNFIFRQPLHNHRYKFACRRVSKLDCVFESRLLVCCYGSEDGFCANGFERV